MDALFDIDDDGEDRGFEATNGQTLSLKLRNPEGANHVLFQVYDSAGANPELGVAAQPPRASKGAPELTLIGATSGQAVSPALVSGSVDVTLPGSGSHSWVVRCVRDQGMRVLPSGKVVVDPALIHERGIWIPTSYGTRKPVATEVQQFELEGWAGALADHIEAGTAGAPVDLVDLIDDEAIDWSQTQTFSGSIVLGTSQIVSSAPPLAITLAANATRLFLTNVGDGDVNSITGASAGRVVFVQNVAGTKTIKHSSGTSSSLICPGSGDLIVGPRDSVWLVGDGSNGWLVSSSRPTFLALGTGAVPRSVSGRLQDEVFVQDFMTPAELAAAYDGTWSVDHQPAIQRAIDYALYENTGGFSSGRKVRLGGGMYRIDRPIHLGYGTDFRSIIFEGDGKREGGTFEGGGCGTVIRAFFNEGMAISIQGARSTVVRGMTIIGQNADKAFDCCFGTANMAHVEASGWVDPSFPAASSSRYTPYSGITIDGYSGLAPSPAYPTVTYPAFLGAVPQYSKGTSRDVLIEDVRIVGFVAGIAQMPGDADGNGDFTCIRRVSFFFNAFGFTWGNSQARANRLDHCIFAGLHTGFASSVHGIQAGNPLITATSCAFETMIQIFEEMNLGYGVGPQLLGCFAEAIYRIGKCNGVSQNAGALSFKGCEFGMSWWARYGVPTWALEMEGSMEASFEQCYFYMSGAGRGLLNFRCAGSAIDAQPALQLAFSGCQTQGDAWTGALYEKCAHNATLGITISQGSTGLARFGMRTGYLRNLDTGALLGVGVIYTEKAIAPRHICAPVYAKKLKSLIGGNDPGVDVSWQTFGFSITSVSSTVGRIVTLVIDGLTTQSLMHLGGDVGDCLISAATGAVFVCKSRTGTTLVLEAMSGYNKDGNLLNSIVAEGVLYPLNCRRYALPAVLYGDTTAGNPTVTNLTLGNNGTPTLADILTADDYLYVDQDVEQVINPFDGSARLVSFNQGARTMTFAGNFNYTQVRRRFCVFVRPAMPNA